MKWMKRLQLVNWHYFQDETLEFGKQTLISGRNSAGKSTIIDALQVLFIADQRQICFNPAAHEEAKRSLINYLRGKIGSDEKSFVRERDFTSYILAEFYDDKTREAFVVGTVIDVYSDNKIDDEYFILPDIQLSQLELWQEKGKYRNREEFHSYALHLRPRVRFDRIKLEYQKAFRNRMGQLEPRFYRTFLRALSFKPIQDIRDFVYTYILDTRELQLSVMKENFELHERYQREMEALQERKSVLERIAGQHEQFIKWRDTVATQEYVIRGLKHLELSENLADVGQRITSLKQELDQVEDQMRLTDEQYREARLRSEDYFKKWSTHELRQEQERLKQNFVDIGQELAEKNRLQQVYTSKLKRELSVLEKLAAAGAPGVPWLEGDREKLDGTLQMLRQTLRVAQTPDITGEDLLQPGASLRLAGDFLAALHRRFLQAQTRLEDKIKELDEVKQRLNLEIRGLEQKKRPYREEVLRLKTLLEECLAGRSPVWIFCEEMEILDEAWRNAIEGYLHTQKFDLLVKPPFFAEALRIYEKEKWTYHLEGVGLVDTEKEQRYLGSGEKGSLPAVLQTDNPVILARLNHLLGRVMQAQDEQDLRTYATAITQSCMSYHNLVARQITKDRYEIPYIGSQAIVRQLEIKREKLAQTEAALRILNGEREELLGWVENLADRRTLYDGFAGQLDLPILIHRLEEERNSLQDKLDHLDLSEVDRLKAEYDIWRQREDVLVEQGKKLSADNADLGTRLNDQETARYLLTKRAEEALRVWEAWRNEYAPELWEKAEERWQDAGKQAIPAASKLVNWENSQKGNNTRRDQELGKLHDLRYAYNIRYTYNGELDAEENQGYQVLLDEVAGVNIPEYQVRLVEALKQSEEEFKADFIAKMREAIEMARYEFNQRANDPTTILYD